MGKHYTLCLIFNKDKTKTLLIKKAKGKLFEGMYNALGGKVEEGETIKQAVIREVFEESQEMIKLTNPKYLGFESFPESAEVPINGNQVLEVFYDTVEEIEIPDGREGQVSWMDISFAQDFSNNKLVGYGNIPYHIRRALANEKKLKELNK